MKRKVKFNDNNSKDDRITSLTSLFTVQKKKMCRAFCLVFSHTAKKKSPVF